LYFLGILFILCRGSILANIKATPILHKALILEYTLNLNLIRCLRVMIFVNCFMLIPFANIGFYFDANRHAQRIVVPWQVLLSFKILVAISGGFQLISLPFLVIWRIYLTKKRQELQRREGQEMVGERVDMVSPEIESGRNPTTNDLFDHV